jgi:hypothetical protein
MSSVPSDGMLRGRGFAVAALVVTLTGEAAGHGHITWPPGRNNGSVASGGDCGGDLPCSWFSQPTEIPLGQPTLPDYARTYNINVTSGLDDWSRKMPWRAPGSAPVLGSGCGVAGGGPVAYDNGGTAAPGFAQGADFLTIPPSAKPTVWQRGTVEEVAWALWANHGGGVSWRLCKKTENVSESCFSKNTLEFVGDTTWIRYTPIHGYSVPDVPVQAVRVSEGTHPPGSHWTRNPVPGCFICDQAQCIRDNPSHKIGDAGWEKQQHCSQNCSGIPRSATWPPNQPAHRANATCPAGMLQFPEPAPGVSGYFSQSCVEKQPGNASAGYDCDFLGGFKFNIVDKVRVPQHIPAGDYLLSMRWDCEQSKQIWQNCGKTLSSAAGLPCEEKTLVQDLTTRCVQRIW